MLGCLSVLSVPRNEQFSERVARGKVSIFSRQVEAIVFTIILFATCAVLKIEEYHSGHIWSHDALRPIARKRKYLMAYKE